MCFSSIFDYFRNWYLNDYVDSLLDEYCISTSEYSMRVFRERTAKLNSRTDIFLEFMSFFRDQVD
jgi:hypothetical protein